MRYESCIHPKLYHMNYRYVIYAKFNIHKHPYYVYARIFRMPRKLYDIINITVGATCFIFSFSEYEFTQRTLNHVIETTNMQLCIWHNDIILMLKTIFVVAHQICRELYQAYFMTAIEILRSNVVQYFNWFPYNHKFAFDFIWLNVEWLGECCMECWQ